MGGKKVESRTKEKLAGQQAAKHEALADLYADLEKRFGPDAGKPLSQRTTDAVVQRWPVESPALSYITGGGFPKGRIVEFFGNESGGKTTLALKLLAEIQRAGGTVAYIDAEHALDTSWATRVGVDVATMLVHHPDTGEEALEVVDLMVRSGKVDCVVVDSVAALVPKAELEGEMGDAHVGLQARLMSQALRKLTGSVSRHNSMVVFINQLREKVGMTGYGPSETTTGGKALKFYASIRLDVRRTEQIKAGEETIGHRMRIKCVKNKVAPPFRMVTVPLMYGRGLTAADELVELGPDAGLITKGSGGWYACKAGKMGQGRAAAADWLATHPEVLQELTDKLRSHYETGEVFA